MQLISFLVKIPTIASTIYIAMFMGLNFSVVRNGSAQNKPIVTNPSSTKAASVPLHQRAGYIAPKALFLGTIYHAIGESFYLVQDDLAMIDVGANRSLQVGDLLTIFRILPAVTNQHTNTREGQPIRIVGDATVTKVNDKTSVIRITLAFDEIEVGHRVERFGALPPQANLTDAPTRTQLIDTSNSPSGSILTSRDNRLAISQGDVVFIDQGAQDGVKQGDQFHILKNSRTAHYLDTDRNMLVPQQAIGKLTVVDVQERSATAQITQSRREFETGDLVQFVALDNSSPSHIARQSANLSNTQHLSLQIPTCLEQARLVTQATEDIRQASPNLVAARNMLSDAKTTFEQAQELIEQNHWNRALQLLQAAQSDCLMAQKIMRQIEATHPITGD